MANKLPEGQFQITDGPSKYDLQASLFDGKVVQITLPPNDAQNESKEESGENLLNCVIF